jgi:hypothetical protein
MKLSILFLFVFICLNSCSAQWKELNPVEVLPLDFSEAAQAKWTKRDNLLKQLESGVKSWDKLSAAEEQLLEDCPETKENIWDILGGGDGWTVMGGPRDVKASSSLANQGNVSYKAKNAYDLNYRNVWVEGVPGQGIGEYLEYSFPQYGPRITNILIVNGYVKSTAAYQNNSRAKKLKMYVKGKPYAILNLRDEIATQVFEVEPIGTNYPENHNGEDGVMWPIRFEIMEVYPGAKYEDVVITEIYFDGLDVLCLANGTMITMADGTKTPIEEIREGDAVRTWNENTKNYENAEVKGLACAMHHKLVKYVMESGNEIVATADHPFLLEQSEWTSSNPEASSLYKGFGHVVQLEVGGRLRATTGVEVVKAIEPFTSYQKTYTITKLTNGTNFIANDVITGIEDLDLD